VFKLDVEGYELQVLRGAARVLEQTEIVYCELSTENCHRFGSDPTEVEQLLVDAGFVFVKSDSTGGSEIVSKPYFANLAYEQLPPTGYNLVAVRPELAHKLVEALSSAAWVQWSA
jgi:hypothetical protein